MYGVVESERHCPRMERKVLSFMYKVINLDFDCSERLSYPHAPTDICGECMRLRPLFPTSACDALRSFPPCEGLEVALERYVARSQWKTISYIRRGGEGSVWSVSPTTVVLESPDAFLLPSLFPSTEPEPLPG